MTEDELFEAVGEYIEDSIDGVYYPSGGATRAKLLAAIDEYTADRDVRDALMERRYDLLSAKAAVCDSFLEWMDAKTAETNEILMRKTDVIVKELRDLEQKQGGE